MQMIVSSTMLFECNLIQITSCVVFVVQVLKRLRVGCLDLVTGEGQPGVEGLVRVKRDREGVVLNSDQALGGHKRKLACH